MRKLKHLFLILGASFLLTSCFTHTYNVGRGAQSGVSVTERNHYLIGGLVPLATSDPAQMAEGAQDFNVRTRLSFVDGLLSGLTFGIWTPTTTTVTR